MDRTPSSPYFGRVYVTNRAAGQTKVGSGSQRATTKGIYILGSDLSDVTNQGNTAYDGGVEWGENSGTDYQTAPRMATAAPNGDVYVCSNVYTSSNVYIMDAANPKDAFTPVFKGSRKLDNKGQLRKGMNVVMNPPMDCYVSGKDENTVLYIMDRNPTLGTVYTGITRYDIGKAELPWYDMPTSVVFDDQLTGSHMENGNGQMFPDARGGWWMSQYRYDGTAAKPSFIHITEKGEIDFNNFTYSPTVGANRQGGMAVTVDGNRLAIMTVAGVVKVFDITYDEQGPAPELAYTLEWGEADDICFGMDFDAAGNLYIAANIQERLIVYSLPNLQNTYTTRISLKEDAVDAVENVSATDGIVVYPNPTQDVLNIRSSKQVEKVNVYSLAGQLQKSESGSNSINVSGLQAGMYILQVQTEVGKHVETFIKK